MNPTPPIFGQDPAHAAWVGPRLTGGWGCVRGVVPEGFEAYVRILHPAEGDGEHDGQTSWADIAAETGATMHALVQWNRIEPLPDFRNARDVGPEDGNLAHGALQRLLDVLSRYTADSDSCWFCLWHGYGWIRGGSSCVVLTLGDEGVCEPQPPAYPDDVLRPDRLVQHPGRSYLLGSGALESALGVGDRLAEDWFLPQSPNLFWPDDHAWCVGTEIDFDSTLVGGCRALIDDLLSTEGLETFPIGPRDALHHDSDRINPARSRRRKR